jgi:hypothetical protein
LRKLAGVNVAVKPFAADIENDPLTAKRDIDSAVNFLLAIGCTALERYDSVVRSGDRSADFSMPV